MTKLNPRLSHVATLILIVAAVDSCTVAAASDWPRFHGINGSGISADKQPLPVTWSETENLKWKSPLPGPGSSSPIVVGRHVFVTCWSGYAANPDNEGDEKDLRRHLVCLDRDTGNVVWDRSIEPLLPEDPYGGMFAQHGYASHTPVSDGERIYVFFGKTGALAFDMDGKRLWQTSVGTDSGAHGWGTASSPILYKDLMIVPAFAESKSLVALDKKTGAKVWTHTDPGFEGTWGTPLLVDCGDGRTDLVVAVPFKVWGLDPETGKPRWHCDGLDSDTICTSANAQDGVIYVLETNPRGGGTIAVKAGGEGDVTKTAVLWRGTQFARIGTPVIADHHIYWAVNRAACCLDATTGKSVYRVSLTGGPAPPVEPFRPGRPRPAAAQVDSGPAVPRRTAISPNAYAAWSTPRPYWATARSTLSPATATLLFTPRAPSTSSWRRTISPPPAATSAPRRQSATARFSSAPVSIFIASRWRRRSWVMLLLNETSGFLGWKQPWQPTLGKRGGKGQAKWGSRTLRCHGAALDEFRCQAGAVRSLAPSNRSTSLLGNSPRNKIASSTAPDLGGKRSPRDSSSDQSRMRFRNASGSISPSMKAT